MQTIVIDNFTGALTRKDNGLMNSGLAKYETSWGYDPFTKPGSLTWLEKPSIIGVPSILANPLTSAKVRVEISGTSSVVSLYGYGPDSKLIKYTVASDGAADLDVGSILTATSITGAKASFGGQMQFFGTPVNSVEKIWIGHDTNILKIRSDGSNANPSVATAGSSSVAAGIARPSAQFLGKLYFGNIDPGTNTANLIEIDSTETVTSYAKLSPGFPVGTYIRDLDVTPDGNYLVITVSRINAFSVLQVVDGQSMASTESFVFYWNGTDSTYTSYQNYSGVGLTANVSFSNLSYLMGNDLSGTALYKNSDKLLTMPKLSFPRPEAVFTAGNMVGIMTSEYVSSIAQLAGSLFVYGQYDSEVPNGLYRLLRVQSSLVSGAGRTDVLNIPLCLPVSNLFYRADSANVGATSKLYFSTSEWTGSSGVQGLLYRFRTVPDTLQGSVLLGVWESQNQVFSKKVKPTEIRLYTKPLVANNQFTVELIGSSGSSVLGGSKTFTVNSSPVQAGADYIWWQPQVAPGHSWGTRITNLGSKNWTGIKLEIDLAEAGK